MVSKIERLLEAYDPAAPAPTADGLRDVWMSRETREVNAIKASDRAKQETVGVSIPDLKVMGKVLARAAKEDVEAYLPLAALLWDEYGREGRVVALLALGAMELVNPARIVPVLLGFCRTCVTWEDVDRLAMDALEPIVKKQPDQWLDEMKRWIDDENKWVRRAGMIVVGRLASQKPHYAERVLTMMEPHLSDPDTDVKKGLSFAIRLSARKDRGPLVAFLERNVPPADPAATWVLCDVIRSMTKKFLPELVGVSVRYEEWARDEGISASHRRSVESAISVFAQ